MKLHLLSSSTTNGLVHLAKFYLLFDELHASDGLESLLFLDVFRRFSYCVSVSADARKHAGSLDPSGKTSHEADVVFVTTLYDFYIDAHMRDTLAYEQSKVHKVYKVCKV